MTLSRTASGQVALLTPYDGGNLGDTAIQDAVISGFRCLDPQIRFSGITLNPDRTSRLHQIPCYLLAVTPRPHYRPIFPRASGGTNSPSATPHKDNLVNRLKNRLWSSVLLLKPTKLSLRFFREMRHGYQSYLFLRDVDLLVVAGGGQLDEEWGGAWGHPYALMKWTVLARLARCTVAFLSVGGCRIDSGLTRQFLKVALSLANYRSYRDEGSRELARNISRHAEGPVVPDLAFSFPVDRHEKTSRPPEHTLHVGVSPIAFSRPGLWPTERTDLYERYMNELALFVTAILRLGSSVVLFSSSTPDEQVFRDLRDRVSSQIDRETLARLSSVDVATVQELIGVLRSVDVVIASRLHGLLLSSLAGKRAVAVSYDRKVRCLMEDLGQSEYCFDIRTFTSDELLGAFLALRKDRELFRSQQNVILDRYRQMLKDQYDEVGHCFIHGIATAQPSNPSGAPRVPACEGSTEPGPVH